MNDWNNVKKKEGWLRLNDRSNVKKITVKLVQEVKPQSYEHEYKTLATKPLTAFVKSLNKAWIKVVLQKYTKKGMNTIGISLGNDSSALYSKLVILISFKFWQKASNFCGGSKSSTSSSILNWCSFYRSWKDVLQNQCRLFLNLEREEGRNIIDSIT